ncbi:MAG: sigma 54-interacting transcriptional regulator [Planctomycetes bacterium]|nr:sigma 54-interacting transcriptional regulator [Planctomycetota bacterium]
MTSQELCLDYYQTTDSIAVKLSANDILGTSPWAVETRRRVEQIAKHRYSVLITGPPGSGKRFLAGILHALSPRGAKPLVPVDCSRLGEQSFASQLFGHEEGAFAGLAGAALGSFRAADGGSLFLGQVERLPLTFQPLLLDAIKSGEVHPLGAKRPVRVDVRLICSSLCDLQKEIQSQRLIPDLYAQLDAVSLPTVALRERIEDIAPLAEYFLSVTAEDYGEVPRKLSDGALKKLKRHPWPGNIAELRTALERAAVLAYGDELAAADFDFLEGERGA